MNVLMMLMSGAHTHVKVFLSGGTAAGTTNDPVGFRFNTDGTIDKRENGSYSQVSAATDWIIPNVAAATDYEVRATSVTGDAWATSPVADDTWIDLSAAREWNVQDTNPLAGGTKSTSWTFEIRKGAGATLSSGSYSATADYEV